jgi:hypothetical protein
MAKGLTKGTTIIRVKCKAIDGWYTAKVFYDWTSALEYYNAAPTPRMLTTKAKIHHKQYTNNGFVYSVPDPRGV